MAATSTSATTTTVNFLSSVLQAPAIRLNPILFRHFNQEVKNLNPASSVKNGAQCQFCFASNTPKLVVKRRRDAATSTLSSSSKKKRSVKKVFFLFCKICGNKMRDRCAELKARENLKAETRKGGKAGNGNAPIKDAKSSDDRKSNKKKKKKEENAGLIIPASLAKKNSGPASSTTTTSKPKQKTAFAGNPGLLKMLKSSEAEKKNKLETFLNA